MKKFLLILLCIPFFSPGQTPNKQLQVTVYKKDTSFSCIVADTFHNQIFVGTNGKGIWRYDNTSWRDWNWGLSRPGLLKCYIRQLYASPAGLWVANSGFLLSLGIPGGNDIDFFGGAEFIDKDRPNLRRHYSGRPILGQSINTGPPTRNTYGIFVSSNNRVWTANLYHDSVAYPSNLNGNSRYYYAPGAVGMKAITEDNFSMNTGGLPDPNITIGIGTSYKDENFSIGKRRSCRAITQAGNEVWVSTDGYTDVSGGITTAGVLRYDLTGNYLGKWDATNTSVPFGTTNSDMGPNSLYTDVSGNVWAGFYAGKGIAVKDASGWVNIGVPPGMPANTIIQVNSISGSLNGEVFFGSNNGLIIYKGKGAYTSDTSWTVYTTSDGLPTNFIRGTSVDKNGTIWLATGSGVVKIQRGDLLVYNMTRLSKSSATEFDVTDEDRKLIATYNSNSPQNVIDKDTLWIAADGSGATILKWQGSNPNQLQFLIKEDPDGTNRDKYGKFVVEYRDPSANDSLRIRYYHPKYVDDLYTLIAGQEGMPATLQVIDTAENKTVLSVPIRFMLPPVLLLHGIWSGGEVWDKMKSYLTTNGLYQYKDYQIATPSYENSQHFDYNAMYIPGYIEALVQTCRDHRFSVGKVDIAAHSMGGILTRLYLQSGGSYHYNIHKFITLNTPHSGSPLGNIVFDKDDTWKWLMAKLGYDPRNGALEDLRIQNDAIDVMLNGPNLNREVAPSYVIHTTDTPPAWMEFANKRLDKWLEEDIKITPNTLINIIGEGSAKDVRKELIIKGLKIFVGSLKYYLLKHTPCNTFSDSLVTCLRKIFGGENDLIVSDVSQQGGVTDAQGKFDQVNHLNVHSMFPVQAKVLSLFREMHIADTFTLNGFSPAKLKWDPNVGTLPGGSQIQGQTATAESVQIVFPAAGATYNPGDTVPVTIRRSSPALDRMLLAWASSDDINMIAGLTADSVIKFAVPTNAMGRIDLKAIGFDATGAESADSSYINVNLNPLVKLDSIKIAASDGGLQVAVKDSLPLTVFGYFSDTVRDITYLPGITWSFQSGGIGSSSNPNYLKGLTKGYDLLTASYQNMSDSQPFEVTDTIPRLQQGGPLPVTLTSFTGKYNNGQVELSWITAQEFNNKLFDVEYSSNGSDYETIGTVAGKGNSTMTSFYSYPTKRFQNGKNYYRLKQTDIDGNFKYSTVVVISIDPVRSFAISLSPNPARDRIILSIKQPVADKLLLVLNSMTGQRVWTANVPGEMNSTTVYLPSVAKGIYVATIVNSKGEQVFYTKLIIQ